MSDIVILTVIGVISFVLITAFPMVCGPIYYAISMAFLVSGNPDTLRSSHIFPITVIVAILFVALEISPFCSPLLTFKDSIVPNKMARMGAHIVVMLGLTYGSYIKIASWGMRMYISSISLSVTIVSLVAGFLLYKAAQMLFWLLFLAKEDEIKKDKEEAERKRLEAEQLAEQQRIAAEQKRITAEREAERQRIAAEQEAERQRIAAEQEAKRKAEEAKKAAAEEAERQRVKEERKRAISNQKAVKDFRDRLAKDYDVDFTFLKNLPTASASSFQEELSEDEAVWARNDERFEAIEKLIRSTGFSVEELQPPRFPYESAFLEYVFSLDSPIVQCADKCNIHEAIRIKNKVLPSAYLIDTMMAIDRAIAGLGEYYKRGIDIYREDYNIMKAGLRGEWAVQDILDMHAGAFLVIHDLRMEFPGRGDRVDSVEIDTLVLAPNGIFAVEVKNYGASGRYKIIVTGDGNWYKEYPPRWDDDTPKREVMQNPFAQNDRHVAFLERFINELLGRGMSDWVHVENIICIANDQVTLETDPGAKQTLTRVSNLYNQLTYDRTQKLTVEELEKIKAAIESKSLPGKKYPVKDYSKQMSWAAEWYRYLIETSDHIIDAARRCATDHPEFFTRIQ